MTAEWHVSINGVQRGPLAVDQIRALAVSGQLKPSDYIWKEGMGEWVAASSVKGLFPQPQPTPPRPACIPMPEHFQVASGAATAIPPSGAAMNAIDIRSLPFSSKAALTWSFFWRGLLITIGSSVAGGLLGGVFGFILGFAGFPIDLIQFVGLILGIAVGCFSLYLYVQWMLTSRLGAYRLQLMHADHRR